MFFFNINAHRNYQRDGSNLLRRNGPNHIRKLLRFLSLNICVTKIILLTIMECICFQTTHIQFGWVAKSQDVWSTWWLITSHYTTAETRPARWRSHQERTEAALWRMVPSFREMKSHRPRRRWPCCPRYEIYSVTGRPSEKRHISLGCLKYRLLSKSPFFLIVSQ